MIKHFTENKAGTDYAVGDIHGCFTKLQEALHSIGFNIVADRLFATADLIDRGPESEDCLEWLAKPWFHSVRGNHESMAIDYMPCPDFSNYARNGGQWFIDLPRGVQQLYANAFAKLPIALDIQVGDKLYGVVHADCPFKVWQDMETEFNSYSRSWAIEDAMWSRGRISGVDKGVIEGVDLVYVGHTPLNSPTLIDNVCYIDTGACYKGGYFTIVKLGELPVDCYKGEDK